MGRDFTVYLSKFCFCDFNITSSLQLLVSSCFCVIMHSNFCHTKFPILKAFFRGEGRGLLKSNNYFV